MRYFIIEGKKIGISKLWTRGAIWFFLTAVILGYVTTVYLLGRVIISPIYLSLREKENVSSLSCWLSQIETETYTVQLWRIISQKRQIYYRWFRWIMTRGINIFIVLANLLLFNMRIRDKTDLSLISVMKDIAIDYRYDIKITWLNIWPINYVISQKCEYNIASHIRSFCAKYIGCIFRY